MSARKREQPIHEADDGSLYVIANNNGMFICFDPWKREAAAEFTWTAAYSGSRGLWYAVSTFRAENGERSGPRCYMHIVLFEPLPRGLEWDHFDGDGCNNRSSNLRAVTHRINMTNRHDRSEA